MAMVKYGTLEKLATIYEVTSEMFDVEENVSKESPVKPDIISSTIGDFGRWQGYVALLMAMLKLPIAWFQLGIIYLAPDTTFWCHKPPEFNSMPLDIWKNFSIPENKSSCFIYNFSQPNRTLTECHEFDYDHSIFQSTIITEWNLVCSRERLIEVSQTVLMFGVLVGNILFGILADKIGRKKPIMIALVLQSITSLLIVLSPGYMFFVIVRFFLAVASGGIAITSFVLCMEIVGGKYRTIVPILYQIPFGLGTTIMSILAYFLREWRQLQLALSIMSALFLGYFWCLPESPRWLLATGQRDKAAAVIEQACKMNHNDMTKMRNEIQQCIDISAGAELVKKPNILSLFASPNIRKKSILLCINWFSTGLCFFAFTQNLGHLGGNTFLTVSFSGIIPVIGSLLCIHVIQRYGRKLSIGCAQLFTGICFLAIIAFPKGSYPHDWPRIILATMGVAGLSVSLPALYLYSGELFPTVSRNIGIGTTSMCSRLGSMLAPFVVSLDTHGSSVPLILLACCSFLQIMLILPLPETMGCALAESLDDAEAFDKERSKKDQSNANYNYK